MKDKFKDSFYLFKDIVNKKIEEFKQISIEKKIISISVLILIISIFIVVSLSNGICTKEEIISKFKTAIENEDVKLLSKTLKIDEGRVDYQALIPLMNYYKDKPDMILNIVKKLRADNKSGMLELKSKKSILGETYYLNINKISVEIKSNFEETEIVIGDKKLKSGEVLERVIPGKYLAQYSLKTEFGDITGEEEIIVSNEESIQINIDAGNITLYSDYKDADVFINNKKMEKKVEEIVDFGPIPLNKNIQLYIEKEFPWGKIKSETVAINDSGVVKIDINMVNQVLMTDIDMALNTFFDSVFDALNEEDKMLIKNADELTKDKIYDDIFKKTLFFTNNYKISDMNLNIEKSEFNYENQTYRGNVVVKISYDIYKKILPFIKESREEMFLVNLEYENDTWIACGIQRFNLYEENNENL